MDEIKAMLESLVQGCLKARNEGEKTDKRKLIDEVAGIMKSAGADDELIRTAIAKMEKLAYDKSEADTADNKAKNEDKEDKKEEGKKEDKAENEDKEGECLYKEMKEKIEKEAENKAKNSIEEFKKEFFSAKLPDSNKFMSQKDGIELGKKLY